MMFASLNAKIRKEKVLIAYVIFIAAALLFDLGSDRSFGALMLSVLPISAIAVGCLIIGPWLAKDTREVALRNWYIGGLLVLMVTMAFSTIGTEQAKTGEIVFTFAALALALPSSLILPFVMTWAEPMLRSDVIFRIAFSWSICMGAGRVQWWLLAWLHGKLQRHTSSSS